VVNPTRQLTVGRKMIAISPKGGIYMLTVDRGFDRAVEEKIVVLMC